jgi:hypothetical protein
MQWGHVTKKWSRGLGIVPPESRELGPNRSNPVGIVRFTLSGMCSTAPEPTTNPPYVVPASNASLVSIVATAEPKGKTNPWPVICVPLPKKLAPVREMQWLSPEGFRLP